MLRKIIIINLILFSINFAYDNAKFEPPDGRVIHGLGQYVSYFYSDQENWQLVYEYQKALNTIPLIYSVYAYIDPLIVQMDSTDFIDIISTHGYPYVLMVGLTLFDASYLITGVANIPVKGILNGDFDQQIVELSERINNINAPVFLRPGFEFGTNNRGIHNDPDVGPEDFKNIWYHIYEIFLQENVINVAWVWNTVNPQLFNYMEWYPGDDYVDWWGINYYPRNQIINGGGFLNDAAYHQKPVFICESAPIENGGTINALNWQYWFVPYFNNIRAYNHIKAFIYISDPFDKPAFFGFWPDSRITSNDTICLNYQLELQDPIYIHMDEYLMNPGVINDTILPPSVLNFIAVPENQRVILSWGNPHNPDFSGVRILRKTTTYPQNMNDSMIIFEGVDSTFIDQNLDNDTTYYYCIYTFDVVSNFSNPKFAMATPHDLTDINQIERSYADENLLFGNAPNPFNLTTRFYISLMEDSHVELVIYNLTGQKIYSVFKGNLPKGEESFIWDGSYYPSGMYFAVVKVKSEIGNSRNSLFTLRNKALKLLLLR